MRNYMRVVSTALNIRSQYDLVHTTAWNDNKTAGEKQKRKYLKVSPLLLPLLVKRTIFSAGKKWTRPGAPARVLGAASHCCPGRLKRPFQRGPRAKGIEKSAIANCRPQVWRAEEDSTRRFAPDGSTTPRLAPCGTGFRRSSLKVCHRHTFYAQTLPGSNPFVIPKERAGTPFMMFRLFLARPTGFEPAAPGVGVFRPSKKKPVFMRVSVDSHKITAIFQNYGSPCAAWLEAVFQVLRK